MDEFEHGRGLTMTTTSSTLCLGIVSPSGNDDDGGGGKLDMWSIS